MTIALNNFMQIRTDEETGERRLFGKAGYQVDGPKVDRYTKANLAAIERALDAGELTDIDGEPVKDGAVIMLYARVTKVKDADQMEQVSEITGLGGATVSVPAAAETEDGPLF